MDKYLSKYEEYLKYELNYSSLTIKGYFTHIIEFNKYLNNKKISYKSLTKQNIINYLKYLDNKKLS
ncbi:MAG: site-specific integrase, partial [Mollicutes bacterium]|nr:site-specific integrase [Mollicutes bacterium]